MTEIFLGVGSNVDAERQIEFALERLATRFGAIAISRVYRNPAIGFIGDDFLNLVVGAHCSDPPERLAGIVREIESAAGRDRGGVRWGPRTLDIDVLIYGTLVDPSLRIPRDDVLRQAFVLCPLVELAPGLRHPVTGRMLADAWRTHETAVQSWTRAGQLISSAVAQLAGPGVQLSSLAVSE